MLTLHYIQLIFPMNITKKIKCLKDTKGWTVSKLAEKCEIPTVSLRAMFKREDPNNYNVKSLIKIAKALETSVSYLTSDNKSYDKISKKKRNAISKSVAKLIDDYLSGKITK